MWLLLSPRLWIALAILAALSFSHFTAYRHGKSVVRVEWQQSIAEANRESLRLERARQSKVDDAVRMERARDVAIRRDAAAAGRELGGLRDDLRAAREYAAQSTAAADATIRALSDVVESCSGTLAEVALDADLARSEVKALRDAWPK